jgi:hypothetical protein
MPTTTFLDPGTDATQDLTFWPNIDVSAGGTAASASDQAHTGTRSLKLDTTGTPHTVFLGSGDGVCADAGTRCSFWMRLGATPSTNMCVLLINQAVFGSGVLGLGVTSSGKIELLNGFNAASAIGAAGATTIAATTWTRIGMSWVITTTTNWTCKIYINGVLELTRTNADATLLHTATSEFGPTLSKALSGDTISNLQVWYDDIYLDNGTDLADPGDIRVTAKRPVSNGTTNGFTTQIGAGGSGYGSGHASQVNEQPLSQTNGWSMVGAGSAVTEEYSVENAATGDVNITGLTLYDWMGWAFASALAGETASLIVGGSTSNAALTSTPTLFMAAKGSTTYPAGGTDIGLITTTALTTVSLYECGVVVAYNPTAPPGQVPRQTYMVGILTQ